MIKKLKTKKSPLFKIIKKAGEIILSEKKSMLKYTEKGEKNFVTDIDYKVQSFLITELINILPTSSIFSEENHSIISTKEQGLTWIIDPLDGTTNVIHNYPYYSISIALINNGLIELGFVYNPVTKELFHAFKDKGAFLNKSRIKVSQVSNINNSLVGFGFPYDKAKNKTIIKIVEKAILQVHDLRRTGSSALDLAYISCGRLDGFFELDLELWDYAAASLLITEAGGYISDWNDISNNYFKSNIIASNNKIHSELLYLLNT